MITINLLHPVNATPVQSWSFTSSSTIAIGRSKNNNVVVLSSVVSRHHVELHRQHIGWEVLNVGANGTFLDGERIDRIKAVDGMVIRLANSGPRIQIVLDDSELLPRSDNASQEPLPTAEDLERKKEESYRSGERSTITNF